MPPANPASPACGTAVVPQAGGPPLRLRDKARRSFDSFRIRCGWDRTSAFDESDTWPGDGRGGDDGTEETMAPGMRPSNARRLWAFMVLFPFLTHTATMCAQ